MVKSSPPEDPPPNRLLAALPRRAFQQLLSALETITLHRKEILHESGAQPRWVYFLHSGAVVSLLHVEGDCSGVEVGMVGDEGLLGLTAFLSGGPMRQRAVVQAPGEAFRMKVEEFSRQAERNSYLRGLLQQYTAALLFQSAQLAACGLCHSLHARLCRWLATMRDRVQSDHFVALQQGMAGLLGVRRTGLTAVGHSLQQAGLIDYRRGQITIIDVRRLVAEACGCYRPIKDTFDRLYR